MHILAIGSGEALCLSIELIELTPHFNVTTTGPSAITEMNTFIAVFVMVQ